MKKHRGLTARVYVLIAFMALWGTVIGARLYSLHIVQSSDLKDRAERQQQRALDISPRRGNIYDRNRNELAASIKADSVFAVPGEIEDPVGTARTLSGLTGVSASELLDKLQSGRSFVWIKRKLNKPDAEATRAAGLAGIYFQQEDRRYYPKTQMAAHVLGYVNIDEEGMGGLEYRYNDTVRGEAGKVVIMTDARRRSFHRMEQPPKPGSSLITTIDQNIQYIVQRELEAAVERTRAQGISIVAMDPRTGEILAMANHPQFNPNEYGRYPPQTWINRAANYTYEPGSTFKIVTAAAALEENLTYPAELIDCGMGSIVVSGRRIRDHKPFGTLSVKQIIQHSSNVGAIKLGLRVGEERLASYIERLGFGRQTGIDLPAEERGLTKPASRWSRVSIGAISIGQEISVTPLQVVSMVSAIANGGILYRPYVVKAVEDPDGGVIRETYPLGERVISASTAHQLQDMLEAVVMEGTAKNSRLEGYRAAGKTGTAQKIDHTGRYSRTDYVASFVGYAPASDPVLSLIVVIDEPSGGHGGGEVAAPVFKRIAEDVLRYMSVPPDVPLYSPRFEDTYAPGTDYSVPGSMIEQSSLSPAATPASLSLQESFETGAPGIVEVPDFTGMSLRQVTEESLKLGLQIRSAGSGAAVAQSPPAGSFVRSGMRVNVQFSSRR